MSRRVFVFGSNLAGRHGKGSAREALKNHRAEWGVGVGPTGDAYAIPTKNSRLQVLPLNVIEQYVRDFIHYAKSNPFVDFEIVDIGCGLSGYKPEQIASFFRGAPRNCSFLGALHSLVER